MTLEMKRNMSVFPIACLVIGCLTSCGPVRTVVVRVDDLRSDFIALESSLENETWQEQHSRLDKRESHRSVAAARVLIVAMTAPSVGRR